MVSFLNIIKTLLGVKEKGVRTMVQAVGTRTNKVYATGSNRTEVLRKLQKDYPYTTSHNYDKYINKVFPETIILVGG